jgi:hypothetical protein
MILYRVCSTAGLAQLPSRASRLGGRAPACGSTSAPCRERPFGNGGRCSRAKPASDKRQISVPMATAIMRTLAVNAARGQARAQQLFSKLLSDAEQARALQHMRSLERAVDYKFYWGKELERRKSLGITGPEPLPHPDDVHINARTGEITIVGPWTKEEKAGHRHVATRRARADYRGYGFSCGCDDLAPRAYRRGAEHTV